MRSGEFISLSACSMILTALGIDIMLPVFGELRQYFGLDAHSTQPAYIVTFFFWGQVTQIVFGVLSDRHGRLPILRLGFPLYIAGGVGAALAPNLPLLFAARFLAGMGASAVMTTTIAGVRDRFKGDAMARMMSFVFTIFLFTPVVAPFLGVAILQVASWQVVFLTPPAFAVVVFLWSLRLKESLPKERRSAGDWRTVGYSLSKVMRNAAFVRYTAITTVLFAGLSSYVASSEHIVRDIYNKPEWFAVIFAIIGVVLAICSLTNARLAAAYGAHRTIRALLIVYLLIAVVLFAGTCLSNDPPEIVFFFTCVGLMLGINLAVEPNGSALALESVGDNAGVAASIYGTCFFSIGASLGSFISLYLEKTVLAIVIGFVVIGIVALTLVLTDKRPLLQKKTA